MTPRRGLSIRYKILFTLTLIPLVMLGVYLLVAINVLKTDKLAYVYESTTSTSKTLSAQTVTELNSLLSSTKPILQEYLMKQNFSEVSHGIMAVESPLQWVAVYSQQADQTLSQPSVLEKDSFNANQDLAKIPQLSEFLNQVLIKERLLQAPFDDERLLLGQKITTPQGTKVFVILAAVPQLAQAFSATGSTESYLVNEDGVILFGPSDQKARTIAERTGDEFFQHVKDQSFSSGAEGIKLDKNQDYLASYAKVAFAGVSVITLVPQAQALKAVGILIIRSLLFMGVLICVTIIISLFASGKITSALLDLFKATKRVAEGDFAFRVAVKSNDEVGDLAGSFNTMAIEVERLLAETAEKARMQAELNTAKTVQETLFPASTANFGNLSVAGYYEPASECGGDWWHYNEIGDRIFLWIGDATGHGAPAALITSAAKSAATIIERLNVEPKEAMTLLNRAIYDVSKGRIMMTFFLACFDKKTLKLTYSNASHEAPFLINKLAQAPKKKDLIPLNEVNDPRLGQARDTVYSQVEVDLQPGDRIVFYTDGLPDIQSPESKAWGEREFIKGILSVTAGFPTVDKSVTNLVNVFSEYRGGASLIDDVTFFMCEVNEVQV